MIRYILLTKLPLEIYYWFK